MKSSFTSILLRLYPKHFRDRFGPEIADYLNLELTSQTPFSTHLRIFLDLGCSVFRERWVEIKGNMKPQKISTYLLSAALTADALSLAFMDRAILANGFIYLASALLIVRLAVEWRRPHSDWWRTFASGILLAFFYALFLPACAKFSHNLGTPRLIPGLLVILPFLLTLFLGILKGIALLLRRTPPRPA